MTLSGISMISTNIREAQEERKLFFFNITNVSSPIFLQFTKSFKNKSNVYGPGTIA